MKPSLLLSIAFLFFAITTFSQTKHYVDSLGSNTTGTGTIGNPWATLSYACSHVSTVGDTIHINHGTYIEPNQFSLSVGVNLQGDDTLNTRIQLEYYSTDTHQAAIMLSSNSQGTNGSQSIIHIWFDGNNISSWGILVAQRNNVSINHCKFTNFLGTAAGFKGLASGTWNNVYATGNTFYNNVVNNSCDRQSAAGNLGGALGLTGQSGFLCHDNVFHQDGRAGGHNGDCVGMVAGYNAGFQYYNNTSYKPFPSNEGTSFNAVLEIWHDRGGYDIYNNTFIGSGGQVDVAFDGGNKGTFTYAYHIHDNVDSMPSQLVTRDVETNNAFVEFEIENVGGDADIYNNRIVNIANGLVIFAGHATTSEFAHRIHYHNNLIINAGYQDGSNRAIIDFAITTATGIDSIFVDNNTIISGITGSGNGSSKSALFLQSSSSIGKITNIFFRNNIIKNTTSYGYITYDGNMAISNVFLQNNDAYNNANSNLPYIRTGDGLPTLSYGANSGNITSNPLLNNNYTLGIGSPAINAGLNIGYLFSGSAPDIGAFETGTISNKLPLANAGPDQIITLPTSIALLTGSGSDSDGTIASYRWTKISGPAAGTITDTTAASTIANGLVQSVYKFVLTVTDNLGGTGKDTIQVTVNPAANMPPLVNAGPDQTITLPTNTANLSGGATDPDGTIASYAWTKISGPSTYTIANASIAITTVTGLVKGTYQFELKATDNSGASTRDTMQVTVNPSPNVPPVANAGQAQTITLPTNTVTLSGSGTDADGTVVSYNWTEISGPATFTIINGSSASTSVTGLVAGIYQFQLLVTDNGGATGTDIVQVTVTAATNIPPVANAGTDQSINLPTNSVTLSGSGTDADGTVVGYQWVEVSGPSAYTIVNASSAVTSITGLVQGTYQFQLTVTDNSNATSIDVVQVVVNAATNIPPVANAGPNQSIILPTSTVTLSGTGTDADGTIATYLWTKISGPSTNNIVSASSPSTSVSGLVKGTYQFQLSVTDNSGAVSTDIVQIRVNNGTNIPPVSNAGTDQAITLPTNTVALSGSGTDADGTIASYLWTEISGPSVYSITNASSASTSVTGLVQGTYQFQLIVTDNKGATATDVMQIVVTGSVNISPVANAGSGQSITLPTNTITLSGSGTDADGTVTVYQWTVISGPSTYNISNAASAITSVTGLVTGFYQFQLTVTDNNGATSTDIAQVTVNAAANIPPVANAGTNQTITLPANSVTLSGSGTDADGTVVSYQWAEISGPSAYSIANASSAITDITGLTVGTYQFQLLVTDNNGATGNAIVQITVNAAANIPPVANAGTNQTIILPENTVTLSGSGSDADGTVASYFWTETSGPATYNIINASSATTDITGLVQGTYVLELIVTDNDGGTSSSSVQITVNAAANIPPVANAGTDQTITLPTNTITLSGSGTDADGAVVSYAWTKISGPSAYSITDVSSANSTIRGLAQGTYQFALTVTDDDGATGSDTMQVIVNAGNIPPVASAGIDQTIILPTNTITLSGSGTDADGTIAGYAWAKISGPSSYSITSSTSASTSLTGLVQGVYQFTLTVTDNGGASITDTMQLIVNPAANIPPVANAGTDQTITLPTNTVTLSGSGSDADGTVASYSWTMISGPSSYTIINASAAVTGVIGLVQGVYQFQLQVTDNNGAIATDIMQVTVNAAVNIPPVANAGADQIIALPVNRILLAGSGTDADGTIASYAWTKISGPSSYTITSATSAATSVTGLVQGVYKFRLKVTDNSGSSSTDIMQVTVNAAANIPPVADAGTDQNITLPVNTVSLSGSGTDADGTVEGYLWTKVSGPSSYTITSATSASTSVTGLNQGVYQFQLKVTDNSGATSTDMMQVTVNAAANVPPVANAGTDQTITSPVSSISLTGSGTDADGTIAGYTWTKVSGPSSYTITSATSAATSVTGLTQGVYQFQLKVTDNRGGISTDMMQVTVNATANVPPVANAGVNQSITLPVNSVSLSGSGTDADGTIVGYSWTKISGSGSYTITSATSAATSVTGLTQGVYQFQLKVTDDSGATSTDVVQVTVNAAVNIPPVANAGTDQTITLPVSSISLTGSGTDADGTIASYAWTKISGPASSVIASASSASTNVTGLTEGVYQFQLKVTDNNGATTTDVMQVTVNPAADIPPVANAGTNQSIALPTNTVTLTGSGTDADGTVVSYVWTKVSGPASYTIASASSVITNVTGLTLGVYQFQLQITDNNGVIGISIIQVTVNAAPNVPPVANAGADQTITLPTNTVNLAGIGTDADGTVATYRWTKISGPSAYIITNGSSATTGITALTQGVYQFELKVTDNSGAIGTDVVQITVKALPNVPPIVNAGADQTITLPTNTVTLSGSATDADGTIASYIWTKISGPSSYTIQKITSASTSVTGLTAGVYKFELRASDNSGAITRDTMQVTVNPAPNVPPVANAGPDRVITLPVNTTALSGSGTDADGTVVSYVWSQISGPSSSSIVNASSPVTDVSYLVQGVYKYQLKVTDNQGATSVDTMQVTVNKANIIPVANAGADQTITLPTDSVKLTGSGIDSDGFIEVYSWNEISGPSGSIVNANDSVTLVNNLTGGTYQFELTVTDNQGGVGKDTITIVVAEPRLNLDPPTTNSANVYPNPVTDVTTLEVTTAQAATSVKYVVSNILGRVMSQTTLAPGLTDMKVTIHMTNFAKGMYTVTVYFDNKQKQSIKLIKM